MWHYHPKYAQFENLIFLVSQYCKMECWSSSMWQNFLHKLHFNLKYDMSLFFLLRLVKKSQYQCSRIEGNLQKILLKISIKLHWYCLCLWLHTCSWQYSTARMAQIFTFIWKIYIFLYISTSWKSLRVIWKELNIIIIQ